MHPSRAEINADRIKRRLRRAEHHGSSQADGGIRAVLGDELCANGQGRAAGNGPDQHEAQRLGRDARPGKHRAEKPLQQLHRAGGLEHLHRRQQDDKRRGNVRQHP